MAAQNEICIDAADAIASPALAAAEAEVKRIETQYSRYRPESVVSRINASAGGAAMDVDRETSQLLDYAQACFAASEGLFDITSGVLRRVWRFDSRRLPTQSAIDALLPLVDWPSVEVRQTRDGATVRLPQTGMELDFGGFGKEYAADRAAAVLADCGVESGYVNLAGDIAIVGPQGCAESRGAPWQIGIAHPREPGKTIRKIALSSGGLTTSGDYERFMVVDGKRYCHILNPNTGWPVRHLASVSVVAPSALIAGSLATIAMLKDALAVEWLRAQATVFLAVTQAGEVVGGE